MLYKENIMPKSIERKIKTVEDTLIYGILKRHIDDFYTFLKQIKANYLLKKE